MESLKLRGKIGIEAHANDYFFQIPSLGDESLGDLLKDFEGIVVSLTVKPLLSICPKCGSRMDHKSNMWFCSKGDFSYYEEPNGKLRFI